MCVSLQIQHLFTCCWVFWLMLYSIIQLYTSGSNILYWVTFWFWRFRLPSKEFRLPSPATKEYYWVVRRKVKYVLLLLQRFCLIISSLVFRQFPSSVGEVIFFLHRHGISGIHARGGIQTRNPSKRAATGISFEECISVFILNSVVSLPVQRVIWNIYSLF